MKYVKAAKTLNAFKSTHGSFTDQIPDLPPINGCNISVFPAVNNNSILTGLYFPGLDSHGIILNWPKFGTQAVCRKREKNLTVHDT